MKLSEVAGQPAVKISDVPTKAIGNEDTIAKIQRLLDG